MFGISCSNSNIQEKVKKVDSLIQLVNEVNAEIQMLDNDSSKAIYDKVKQEVDFIGNNLKELPQDSVERTSLAQYANHSKGLKRIYKNLSEYKGSVDYSLKQLADLKLDIQSETLKEDEFTKYFSDEETAAVMLKVKVRDDIEKFNRIIVEVDSLQPVIDKIMNGITKESKK